MAERNTKVFISYSRKDRQFAARLAEALERQDGIEVFRDTEDILPTEEWKERLEQLIGQADTIVFALSPHSAASEVCGWEVDHAESLNKRIAPIVISDVQPDKIPRALTRFNYIFFTQRDDFDKALTNLVAALNTDIDWIREHTRLGEFARRWDAQRKLGAQPLRGKDLTEAEDWLARQPENAPPPTALHREYVASSRRTATRRQRFWVSGSVAAAIVTTVLAGFAYIQKLDADQAKQLAEQNLEQALSAADTLVVEIAKGMRDFEGVPIDRIRSVLEKAEAVLKGLETSATSNDIKYRQALMLDALVDAYWTLGDLGAASERAARSLAIMFSLAASDPQNGVWQRDLAVAYEKSSNIRLAQGDLVGAEQYFHKLHAIRERLVASYPDNFVLQRDLALAVKKLANLFETQGDLSSALAAYRESRTILEKLIVADPEDPRWQRALSLVHNGIGQVRQELGDLTGALKSFRGSVTIAERLSATEPANTVWKHDLAKAHSLVGGVQITQGDLTSAFASFRTSITIRKSLAATDPKNATWQRDLAAALNQAGGIQKSQGNNQEALSAYRESLGIRQRLAAADPTNMGWLSDVAFSHKLIGNLQVSLGDAAGALVSYGRNLDIRNRLAAAEPGDASRQYDLSVAYEKIGDMQSERGDLEYALTTYNDNLAIRERLVAANPETSPWRADLAAAFGKLGLLLVKMNRRSDALDRFKRGRAIIVQLAESSENVRWKAYLAAFDRDIASLEK